MLQDSYATTSSELIATRFACYVCVCVSPGYVNTTFLQYNATMPPASVFNVPGIQYCASGDGDQCPDSTSVSARIKHRLKFLARAGAEALLDQANLNAKKHH